VQIFADRHGNFVHLGDRDCSIQRRHQKVIEEAPAPALPQDVRDRLRAAALIVGREIGYVSAGTVEFLFDGGEFYFMEMNTRLQVEHTVTERITGLDLVEWQLRIAAAERLPLTQAEIRLTGHAIEARVCAEDPEREFLPSAGELRLLDWPTDAGIRVDAGFGTGDVVPDSYDSLLGKVIAWEPTREAAASSLRGALRHTYCAGVRTNERWLARILANPLFLEVRHSIAFLETHGQEILRGEAGQGTESTAIALGALALQESWGVPAGPASSAAAVSPWTARDGFSPNLPASVQFALQWRGQQHSIDMQALPHGATTIKVDNVSVAAMDVTRAEGLVTASIEGKRVKAQTIVYEGHVHIWLGAEHYDFVYEDPRAKQFSASASSGDLTTPLPGVVAAVAVKPGQAVVAGEVLMVIEAMKMEHTITAPYAGTVHSIHFARGDRVPEGSTLLELAAQE
jgi:3-methylcrotonyl-CoA carboxylase alpha subunit